MGEKRAYKARKPGGGRKKLKPEYDAGKNLKNQIDAAVALYEEDCSLQSIADVLNLNPIKVRKLLITAGVYAENEIEAFRQTKAEKEKELAVVQEELQQKKQIAGNTEVLLTADNLQQYVKKIEVDHKKNTYTEFVS